MNEILERIADALERIAETLEAQQRSAWATTPEGLPICPRHGVPMTKREKQGDTWYSHSVEDPKTGDRLFCRGYPGKSSPGWDVTPATPPERPAATSDRGHPARPAQPRQAAAATPAPTPTPATPPAGELAAMMADHHADIPADPAAARREFNLLVVQCIRSGYGIDTTAIAQTANQNGWPGALLSLRDAMAAAQAAKTG